MMRVLNPRLQADAGEGMTLYAKAAALDATGTGAIAMIEAWNGEPKHIDMVDLTSSVARRRYAEDFARTEPAAVVEEVLKGLLRLNLALPQAIADTRAATVDDPDGLDGLDDQKPSQATALVRLARSAGAEFFATPDGDPYATVPVGDHRETFPLRAQAFRRWLQGRYYEQHKAAAGSQAVQDALGVLEAGALFDGAEHRVHVRVAEQNGAICIDLGDTTWRVVWITEAGWDVVAGDSVPVRFRRPAGLLPLPEPQLGGTVHALRNFVYTDDDTWKLMVGWLLAALRGRGPFPILALLAEQGSGKSTFTRLLRRLIDPHALELGTPPRSEDDLVIAASRRQLLTLDNVSHVADWLSDALCRIATGGGLSKRTLYTDSDETILAAMRPLVVNAITDALTRADLLDRAVLGRLSPVPEADRRTEADIERRFQAVYPRVLGALYTAVATGLKNLPMTTLTAKPRMADFAVWVEACAPALGWQRGDFLAAYAANRQDATTAVLDDSPIAEPLRKLSDAHPAGWEDTPKMLLTELERLAGLAPTTKQDGTVVTPRKPDGWPKQANVLSNLLKRIAPSLRATGIDVQSTRASDAKRTRHWRITCLTPSEKGGKPSSRSSEAAPLPDTDGGSASDGPRTVWTVWTVSSSIAGEIVQGSLSGTDDLDDLDDLDGHLRTSSKGAEEGEL